MATYQELLHSVALRANALVGAQVAALETTYSTTVLTDADFKSADFPFSSFRDAILQGEQDIVTAIAFTGNHPWRSSILGVTDPLTTAATLPDSDSNGVSVVGLWGAVYDSDDDSPLVEMPLDVILRRTRNANSHYVCPVYYYKIDGNRIYHTRTEATLECCIYSRTAQVVAYDANDAMLLPNVTEPAIVARALSFIFRDSVYVEQASAWRKYSDEAIAAIRAGATSMPSKSVPVAITEMRAA